MAVNSNCVQTSGGKFKATQIWNVLVEHLQENANTRRHKNTKKYFYNCFTGANAVDVLYQFVKCNPEQFKNALSLPRENISRLCQSFLDMGVIKDIENDSDRTEKFEDSSASFYTFDIDETAMTNKNATLKRQVLREIDGDIRNSLGHISISNSQVTKCHTVSMRRKFGNRPRVPSFTGMTAQALKDSFMTKLASDSNGRADPTDKRGRQNLKRTSSLVERFVKRSSSASNLQSEQSSDSSVDAMECNENESRKARGRTTSLRKRFSQRLSFKKKSLRKSEQNPQVNKANEVANLPTNGDTQDINRFRIECIRVRLLQVLDLPFVDGVIMSPETKKKFSDGNETDGVQYSEVAASYNREDNWISSAMSIMQRLPGRSDVLRLYARDSDYVKKIKLFDVISNHYKAHSKPLIDGCYLQVMEAIEHLLEQRLVMEAIEALQLFYHLLPESLHLEIKYLITFLHSVVADRQIELSAKCDNQSLILRLFFSVIFPPLGGHSSRHVTNDPCDLLRFSIEHCHQVFNLPEHILATVKRRRALLEGCPATNVASVPDSSFCSTINQDEFDRERVDFTQKQLDDLARFVSKDVTMTTKKKRDFLKKLQSSHPNVYECSRKPLKATVKMTSFDEKRKLGNRSAPSTGILSRRRPVSLMPLQV